MKTRPGLVLEGRYKLQRLIATGGMGQVWRGHDQELDREVAVKVLREEYAGEESFLKRFRAEARHTAALSHDGIAALYDYGEVDGRAYIVMELCPGRPLSDIIEENPRGLPEKRVVPMLIALARALDAAHAKGVVHRDVKPENLLIDESDDWSMKITDFGIARSADQARLTKTGLVMGTAQYLSPEQAMGKQATSLSDIYALGIVAYEMLVGHRPFTGSSQVEIAMAQVKQQPPELPESIDPDLRRLVMATLAKAPANRPRSAAAVARVLEALQRGEEPGSAADAPAFGDRERSGSDPVSAGSASAGSAAGASAGSPSTAGHLRPGASPTGTRTAAMPLPLSGRGRGIRHRSSATAASGPSALSAASASSAPRRNGRSRTSAASALSAASANPADAAGVAGAKGAAGAGSASGAGARAGATRGRHDQSPAPRVTGRKVGPFTIPGLFLLLLVLAVIVGAVLAGSGVLGAGAAAPGGPAALSGPASPAAAVLTSTIAGSVQGDHGTRMVEL